MGKNILSIDDDEDILYTIQEIILHQGWTPLLARNFREAEHILTQYGNGRLDLIHRFNGFDCIVIRAGF